ncbi:protein DETOXIFICATION 49 [Selaginella moellendorffii]|nr:protein DETOXIFICATION 49 [Selaginella moellendorffii]|eukprot:XP_002982802.2 protein DETOXIFICATION 49 [Selaginella moellendorffii]
MLLPGSFVLFVFRAGVAGPNRCSCVLCTRCSREKEIENATAPVNLCLGLVEKEKIQIEGGGGGDDARNSLFQIGIPAIRAELAMQFRLGCPIMAMNLIWFAKFLATTLFLGRLGGVELAGGAPALTFANVTGYSILLGLATGMEPICSQAFGAGRMDLMASALQNAILMLLLACIPIALAWLYSVERFLIFLGQDPSLARASARFLKFLLPDLFLQAVITPLRIFLRCQSDTLPMTIAFTAGILLHIGLGFLLAMDLRGAGIALAMGIGDLFTLALLLSLVLAKSRASSSKNPKIKNTKNTRRKRWKPLIKLALPSCAMVCLEWWSYEAIVLLAGLLQDPEISVPAAAIVLNLDAILYALQITLASCTATRIGHELGANSPSSARTAAIASLLASLAMGFVTFASLAVLRSLWGRLFTADPAIVRSVRRSMPVAGAIELANFPLLVLCGILRGSARPAAGAVASLGSFYLIGLPCGVALGFGAGLGLVGLWLGLLAAVVACVALTGMVVLGTDWKEMAMASQLQIRSWDTPSEVWHSNDPDGKEMDEI